MKHVETFIRHLQSSTEKRKEDIRFESEVLRACKQSATHYYAEENSNEYVKYIKAVTHVRSLLKTLHKQQKTETEMLKWLENIRSCHEAVVQKDVELFDFSLEESQHD